MVMHEAETDGNGGCGSDECGCFRRDRGERKVDLKSLPDFFSSSTTDLPPPKAPCLVGDLIWVECLSSSLLTRFI